MLADSATLEGAQPVRYTFFGQKACNLYRGMPPDTGRYTFFWPDSVQYLLLWDEVRYTFFWLENVHPLLLLLRLCVFHLLPCTSRHETNPWQVMALYEKIQNDPLDFPSEVNMSPGLKRLLTAMMEKEPAKRIALDQVCPS